MKKKFNFWFIGIVLFLIPISAFAADLITVFHQALLSDPAFNKAAAQRMSTYETWPQALSALGPNLSGDLNAAKTKITNSTKTPLFPSSTFTADDFSLTLNQPIFNFASWMKVAKANEIIKEADAIYGAALQDLIIRVSNAYFNVLLAEDMLRITLSQKTLLAKQYHDAKENLNVGTGTKTITATAQAAYDTILAQEIFDRNNVINQYESLRALTGQLYSNIDRIKKDAPIIYPKPMCLQNWLIAAEQQNLSILANRFAAEAARKNIKAQFGGHLPTINATGTLIEAHGGLPVGQNFFIGPLGTIKVEAVGVNVHVPIFESGLVTSEVRQAKDDYLVAVAELDRVHRQVDTQTHQVFNNLMAWISKLKADKQSINSNQITVQSTQTGYEVGVNTIVELLSAQKNLFDAQRQYFADEYAYLSSILSLKQLAGTLNEKDLMVINEWLIHHRLPKWKKNN